MHSQAATLETALYRTAMRFSWLAH